ncbi:MAG: hypothetical protein GY806_18155 [Gammaproteobacteria bacterium]|nr:hypothetical protein [Gammaproteobacteria bacterium]
MTLSTYNIVAIDTTITAWNHSAKHPDKLPQTAQLVCSYWLNVIIEEVKEELYFSRTQSYDFLWTYLPTYRKARRVIKSGRAGAPQIAAERLFRKLTRARSRFEGPSGFIKPGLINLTTYNQVIQELHDGFKTQQRGGETKRSPVVRAAR